MRSTRRSSTCRAITTPRTAGGSARHLPEAIHSTAILHRTGLSIAGLTWRATAARAATGASERPGARPCVCTRRLGKLDSDDRPEHVPPPTPRRRHRRLPPAGSKGYRWLLEHLEPTLWLHGHTPLAATREWKVKVGPTTVVNVSGAVVIDLLASRAGSTPVGARALRPRLRPRKTEPDR